MQLNSREPVIFELSKPGRGAVTQFPPPVAGTAQVNSSDDARGYLDWL